MKNILLLFIILFANGKTFSQTVVTQSDLQGISANSISQENDTTVNRETCTLLSVKVYPNPAHGYIHFDISGGGAKWLKIYTVNGACIETDNIYAVSTLLLPLNMFVGDVYIYIVTDDTGNILGEDKFIVQ